MSNLDEDRVVGSLGMAITRIPGGDRPGEVQVSIRGGSESFIAYGVDPIGRGEQVMIVGRRPGRILDVIAFHN
jgi:membrane protein implicated in regulation of membrane protease activity